MPDQHIYKDDAVSGRPTDVDVVGKFFSLKDSQVHIGLGHPSQRRLQTPVSVVTNIVGAEPN